MSADSNFANMNIDGNATISTAEHVSQNDPADLSESNSNVNVFINVFLKAFVKAFVKAFIASSRQNICRWRDPKCNFDLIPRRNIKNQWKKFVIFQDLAISLHGKNDIARESRAISFFNCSDIVVQASFCSRYQIN